MPPPSGSTHTLPRLILAASCLLLPFQIAAQTKPVGPFCMAPSCEAGTIYAVSIDSLTRHYHDTLPPRVLANVYTAPFLPLSGGRPAPAARLELVGSGMLTRHIPGARIVDSTDVLGPDHMLSPGGPLFVVSPLDWMGEDLVRLEIARYPTHWAWGEQYFVLCERGPRGWRVRQIDIGWQN